MSERRSIIETAWQNTLDDLQKDMPLSVDAKDVLRTVFYQGALATYKGLADAKNAAVAGNRVSASDIVKTIEHEFDRFAVEAANALRKERPQ